MQENGFLYSPPPAATFLFAQPILFLSNICLGKRARASPTKTARERAEELEPLVKRPLFNFVPLRDESEKISFLWHKRDVVPSVAESPKKGRTAFLPLIRRSRDELTIFNMTKLCTSKMPHNQDSLWSSLVCFSAMMGWTAAIGFVFRFGIFFPVFMDYFKEDRERTGMRNFTCSGGSVKI